MKHMFVSVCKVGVEELQVVFIHSRRLIRKQEFYMKKELSTWSSLLYKSLLTSNRPTSSERLSPIEWLETV